VLDRRGRRPYVGDTLAGRTQVSTKAIVRELLQTVLSHSLPMT
jgi:hypothetical protein